MLALLLSAATMAVQPTVAPPVPIAPRISPAPRVAPDGTPPAMTNIAEVFDADAYPSESLQRGEEGVVRARVGVDAKGRPTSCTIVASSGSASLDMASCKLIRERGTFSPARDRRKRAVAGDVTLPIRWQIQTVEQPLDLTDFSVRLNYALKAGVPDGACRAEMSPAADSAKLCEESRPTALNIASDIPEKDRAGVGELVMFMDSRQGVSGTPSALMGIPGLIILDERYFKLTIDAAGKVVGCSGGGSTLAAAGGEAPFCARFREQKYAASPTGGSRTILFRSQIYARK